MLPVLVVSLGAFPSLAHDFDDFEIAPGEPSASEIELGPWEFEVEQETGTTQQFLLVAAHTFVPYDEDTIWNYSGAGCIHRTGGTPFRDIDVQIPNGSEIYFLRLYFYDNDPSNNAGAFLFTFDGAGGFTNIAGAMSSGTPGQSSAGSGFFSHFVDTVNQALTLRLDFGGSTNSNLRICRVRLRYTAPPLIFADGFETGDVVGWSRRVP